MLLPRSYRPTSPPPFPEPFTVGDPAIPNAPGLEGNKNGPPGPEGNQRGPPGAVTSTEELASSTSQSPPSGTGVSDSPAPPASSSSSSSSSPTPLPTSSGPTKSPDNTLSSVIVTFVAPTPSTTSTTSFRATRSVPSLAPNSPGTPPTSLTPAVYGSVAGTQYSILGPPSSGVSDTSFPAETTPRRSFTYTSSATPIQTKMGYHTTNGTAQSEYNVLLPGQKAGIAVGTIGMFQSPLDRDHLIS
jgi:hypothetical protein